MIEGIIGRKVGMTQLFDDEGRVIPVTLIEAGPCTVIQKKSTKRDGYDAVQLSLPDRKANSRANRPATGHFKAAGVPPARVLREFRFEQAAEVKPGDQFFVDIFKAGDKVNIIGSSKGKGFAGVVKRWGFHGGRKTHGSMFHRAPGSTGCSAYPSRVMKGKKMPGQMGSERVTVKNLVVVESDKDKNLLVVKGAVPGANGGLLFIKKSKFTVGEAGRNKSGS